MILDSIQSDRIRLRCLDPYQDDLQNYLLWMRSPRKLPYIAGTDAAMLRQDLIAYLIRVNESADSVQFAISIIESGEHIGNIKFHDIEPNLGTCKVGFLIGEDKHRGKGYAGEAFRLGTMSLKTFCRLSTVRLGVDSSHQMAVRAYEKMGFRIEKKLHDNGLQMMLDIDS